MVDLYRSYAELAKAQAHGEDFRIDSQDRGSAVLVLAPHGGGIEPGTSEICLGIAGEEYSFYIFEAVDSIDCQKMHITSTRFDEPTCLSLLRRSQTALTIHGCTDRKPVVYVGGLDRNLRQNLVERFQESSFHALVVMTGYLAGRSPENICNRTRSGKGVQLEVSRGIRDQLFPGPRRRDRANPTDAFYIFINAVRAGLSGRD